MWANSEDILAMLIYSLAHEYLPWLAFAIGFACNVHTADRGRQSKWKCHSNILRLVLIHHVAACLNVQSLKALED